MRGPIFRLLTTHTFAGLEYPVTSTKQNKNFAAAWLQWTPGA
jgi:hypothetical protein